MRSGHSHFQGTLYILLSFDICKVSFINITLTAEESIHVNLQRLWVSQATHETEHLIEAVDTIYVNAVNKQPHGHSLPERSWLGTRKHAPAAPWAAHP